MKNIFAKNTLALVLAMAAAHANAQINTPAGTVLGTGTNTNVGIGPGTTTPAPKLLVNENNVNSPYNGNEEIFRCTMNDAQTSWMEVSNLSSADGDFLPHLWGQRDNEGPAFWIMGNLRDQNYDVATDAQAVVVFDARAEYNAVNPFVGYPIANRCLFEFRSGNATDPIMSIYPHNTGSTHGRVGIGNFTAVSPPSEQLHTTGGVRFAGLTANAAATRTVVSDANGKLYYITGGPVTATCNTANTVPVWTSTGNQLGCSIMQQNLSLGNCGGVGTHSGVGVGGAPIATATSGGPCYNVAFTVYGAGLASSSLWIASDRKFKENVKPLESSLDRILKLKPVTYNFKTGEYPEYNFPNGTVPGFIAQEVEEVLPDAVATTDQDFKTLNYDAMMPALISAFQEQHALITSLQQQVDNLEQRLTGVNSSVPDREGRLEQNAPNPFGATTVIKYTVAATATLAQIKVYDLRGNELQAYAINGTGQGQIEIPASSLQQGSYVYKLLVDGRAVDSKVMTLIKP